MAQTAESKVTIKIPRPLYRRLQAIIEGTGFDSVTDFVVYVLRDIASTAEGAAKPVERESEGEQLSTREVEMVRKRLQSLGYL